MSASKLLTPVCPQCGQEIQEQGFTMVCGCGRRNARADEYPEDPPSEPTWYDLLQMAIIQEFERRRAVRIAMEAERGSQLS